MYVMAGGSVDNINCFGHLEHGHLSCMICRLSPQSLEKHLSRCVVQMLATSGACLGSPQAGDYVS